jgi:hypothetical protein
MLYRGASLNPYSLGVFLTATVWGQYLRMQRSRHRRHVGTLGSFLSESRELWLSCNAEGCGWSRKMDVPALIAAHGETLPLQQLVEPAMKIPRGWRVQPLSDLISYLPEGLLACCQPQRRA